MEEDGDGPSIVRLTIRIIYMIVNFLWITQLYFISGKIVQKVKKAQKKKKLEIIVPVRIAIIFKRNERKFRIIR